MSQSDQDENEEQIRNKAISQIEKELQEINETDLENESDNSDSDEGDIKVDFKKKSKVSNEKNKTSSKSGIMGLKFMQRAEANKKEHLKDQAKMLIEQIKEEQQILD